MNLKALLQCASLVACALITTVARADFIASQAQSDGSYVAPGNLATPTQATAEAVRTLRLLGRGAEVAAADAFLVAETYHGTEYLSRKIVAGVDSGHLDGSLVTELLTHQNSDGGFGESPGYDSNPLDTAFALDALTRSSTTQTAGLAVNYLLQAQGPDGSWSGPDGAADFYTTSLAARALFPFDSQYAAVPSVVANAATYLASGQAANGSWSSDFLSAQALMTLATVSTNSAAVKQGAAGLSATQLADGSWSEDVYSTALALRALLLANQSAANAATAGGIAGYVLSAQSNEPLPGASVTLSGSSQSTQTNSAGYFLLSGVPSGNYTVVASLSGYSSASVVANVQAQQTSTVTSIILTQANGAAVVRGSVFDDSTQLPIAGATVALSAGTASYSATTASDGSFEVDNLSPGTYSVTFQANGYANVTGSLSAPAGSVTAVRQGLATVGTFQDSSPGTLSGRVVDASSGQPVSGVALSLSGATTATATSAGDGTFTFTAVQRGNVQILASAAGYVARTYSFVFAAGDNGSLGSLPLYAATGAAAATTLTVVGTVVDGIDGHALAGASISVAQTGQTLTADANGAFTLSGLTSLTFNLTVSDAGYQTRGFGGTASGFGQVSGSFALTPNSSGSAATSSILRGTVTDSASLQPIGGALLAISGTNLTATSASDGTFEIDGIQPLSFTLAVSAAQYTARNYPVNVTQAGTFALNPVLTAIPSSSTNLFQILTFTPVEGTSGANTLQHFSARVVNLQSAAQNAVVLADVIDGTGTTIATVSPYAPGTTTPTAQLTFAANASINLVIPWNTGQFAPGAYRLTLRIVQPGTVTRDLPAGVILSRADTQTSITATASVLGQLSFNPPLSQAGSNTPVALSALIINSGNVPLTGTGFTLTIADATSGAALTSAQANVTQIAVGNNTLLSFGSWTPTVAGNLPVTVSANDGTTQGTITGTLYVGDKATGTFTVDRSVVPLGTQTVHATVDMQGVDATTATSTDPLFAAVKAAVNKGGLFVGPQVRQWNQTNRCLGCHIQTQSLMGMSAALNKADNISAADVQYLYNDIAGSLQSNGTILPAHTDLPETQTALAIWALADWQNAAQVFRPLYQGSVYQLSRMSTSGNQSWWNYDYCGIWVCNVPAQTMNSVKGLTATLRMAAQLKNTPVNNYTFVDSGQSLGERDVQGIQQTADGSIWFTDAAGNLSVHNPSAGTTRVVASGLGSPSLGLVVLSDGTAWVTSNTALTKVAPNGTTTRIPVPGSQWLWDMVQGPDGALYVADQYTSTIWRVTLDGTVSSFATGGLLNQPLSLSFDSSGNMLVANYQGWNIIQIAPTGTMSVFSDGLPFQPAWLKRGSDGYLYAMTVQYSNYGYTPPGVFRIDSQGSIERLPLPFSAPNQYGFNSLAAINGNMCVNNGSDYHLYCLQVTTQDTSQLPAMLAAITGAAQYTLATYGDNGQWNDIHAMRLITLAEARTQITDTNLLSQIDTAIANIATLLRSRQSADGGWKYTTGSSASDPYATAFVGLALEYTNPSASDPVLRNAINFLLNSQQPDGSWAPQTGPFTTKLGPASFVMAFMPKALDLLGGIDTGLNLTFPPSVQLANPSLAPTTQSTASDGSTTYSWSLLGVTSEGRSVDFDLTLANMGYQEVRPVATAAYLGFANSFTNQTLTSNLTIPTVSAVGAVAVAVATDQQSYPANAPVAITSTVTNAGISLPSGAVHVMVHAADGTLISDLGTTAFGTLATGASTTVPAAFNTGTLLAGNYSVESQLLDQNAQLIGDSTAPFAVVAPTATVVANITADKTSYQAWDTVTLTSRVQNVSQNAYQSGVTASLTVQTPAGATLYQGSFNISSLAPGAINAVPTTIPLADAASGAYPVQLVLTDTTTHNVITTVTTTVTVTRNTLQALSGKVSVQAPQLYQGVSELCSETVSNLSATALSGVTLTQQVVNLSTSQVVQTTTQSASFGAQQQQVFLNSVPTGPLALGGYACVVSATYQGTTQQIGSAGFQVLQPPIVINSSFGLGKNGRVLVLMDAEPSPPCGWLSEIELWAPFATQLPANATVQVDLRDASGKVVDTESLALASYRGTVNRNVGKGADLSITGLSPGVLTVDIRSANGALSTGYRVVATVTAPSLPPMVVDSGSMGTQAGWPVVDGAHFGDFASVNHTSFGDPRSGARDKHETRPTPEPDPSVEKTFLSGLLQSAGLSYTLVNSADDFVTQLHTGAYSQFALLARHVELGSETRKELREAVFNGAGLLYAAQPNGEFDDDDPSDFGFDDTFGIALNWGDVPATGVQLTTSTLGPVGGGSFAFEEQVACITRLSTAQVDGIFTGVPSFCKNAVTNNTYGNGKAVYAGYDLLAEATHAGNNSVHASLLTGALEYLSPSFGNSFAGHVVPLQLQLTNAGVAVPGRVQLPLPTGTTVVDPGTGSVANGVLTWPFSLAVSQQLALNAWIQLPDTAASETFVAQIQTGTSGNFTHYAQDTLTIAATANATLAQARAVAASSHAFAPVLYWLDAVQFWVDQKRPDCAVASLLTATDYLLQSPLARTPDSGQGGATTAQVDALRWDIDQVIWTLSQTP